MSMTLHLKVKIFTFGYFIGSAAAAAAAFRRVVGFCVVKLFWCLFDGSFVVWSTEARSTFYGFGGERLSRVCETDGLNEHDCTFERYIYVLLVVLVAYQAGLSLL